MRRHVLVLESTPFAVSTLLAERCCTDRLRCDTLSWSRLALDGCREHDADVIVAIAPADPHEAGRLSALLAAPPPRPPVIAVLPSTLDGVLLASVARRADDFIVWGPDRVEEL